MNNEKISTSLSKRIIVLICFGLCFYVPVQAGEETKTIFGDLLKGADIGVEGSVAFNSKYIWRGFRLDNDPVLQPSITISAFKGWALNVWANFDLENEDELASN